MAENVDNIILEQLRLIREDISRVEERLGSKIEHLEAKVDGHTGVMIALGRYVHDIDQRVERLEEKIGDPA
jgi:hypothetical protein